VAVSLLSFIVIGLLMTFNQTQRAFRGSMTQTDVLESGRIFTDMIARELEQAGPSKSEFFIGNVSYPEMNFFIEPSPYIKPVRQGLPGSAALRKNQVQQFFFLSRFGQDWVGTGYVVLTNKSGEDVGALYRFSSTVRPPFTNEIGISNVTGLMQTFRGVVVDAVRDIPVNGSVTDERLHKVADGIVHLELRAFSPSGQPLLPVLDNNLQVRLPNGRFEFVTDTRCEVPGNLAKIVENAGYYFYRDAIPASVHLEVGVLEQNILGRYRALAGNPVAQLNYLSNRVGNVHLFRQGITLRNADTSVYP
jgi:hypothetical protein